MIEFARTCAKEAGLDLLDGCYSVWPLPNFETAADIQFTKQCGSLVSGASTVPEQMAAWLLGVKVVGFAAVTNPATGTTDGWVHDGEHNLIAAKKCLEGLRKTIWKVIERFQFNPEHKVMPNYKAQNSLRLKQLKTHLSNQEVTERIGQKISKWTHRERIDRVIWLMRSHLYDEFID